jgi:hypothetical protein
MSQAAASTIMTLQRSATRRRSFSASSKRQPRQAGRAASNASGSASHQSPVSSPQNPSAAGTSQGGGAWPPAAAAGSALCVSAADMGAGEPCVGVLSSRAPERRQPGV